MGAVVTGILSKYDAAGAVSTRMNLIRHCPALGLGRVQQASFSTFETDLYPNDPIPEQP